MPRRPRRARNPAIYWLAALPFTMAGSAHAESDPLEPTGKWTANTRGSAATPPMGWNSWNAFRTEVDEAKVMGAAQALVDTGLAKLGYVYVNSTSTATSSATSRIGASTTSRSTPAASPITAPIAPS